MSDGNFNRALLPHTPFANGLAIGRKQGLQVALQAFEDFLNETEPGISEDEKRQRIVLFRSFLKL